MTEHRIAILFEDGSEQAVRLPPEFRFAGNRVRVRRYGNGVLIEPFYADTAEWFAALDAYGDEPFMSEGRSQPPPQD